MELTHLFVGEEEYFEDVELIESLAKKMVVAVIANPDFKRPPGSKVRILPKPFYCFPVVTLLNQDPSVGENRVGKLMCKGVKALVVDDEPMNHMVAKTIFKRYGMEVFTADSGKESISMCETGDYDIIFMDHMMPEMDGIEAMKRIRNVLTRRHREIPIVALTANAVSTAKEMFLREGFDGFISKPIELSELERVLGKVLPNELCIDVYETEDETFESVATVAETEPVALQETVADETYTPLEQLAALGIDTRKGMHYCQEDEDFYKQLLLEYVKDADKKGKEASDFCSNKDYANYRIMVHALKSTSKMIGATKLGELAKALEDAAKDEDEEFIRINHETAMTEYKRLVAGISRAYEEAAGTEAVEGDEDTGDGNDDVLEFLPEEV
jgi:CheY-like chemotaxis protein